MMSLIRQMCDDRQTNVWGNEKMWDLTQFCECNAHIFANTEMLNPMKIF